MIKKKFCFEMYIVGIKQYISINFVSIWRLNYFIDIKYNSKVHIVYMQYDTFCMMLITVYML